MSRYSFQIIVIIILTAFDLGAQITSPYSIFGIGYIEGNSIGVNKAMGGTGIAFNSGNYINHLNPASYSGLDSLYTFFDFGFEGKYASFKSNKNSLSHFDGSFKYVAMGFRLSPRISASFGLTPYSTIGYNITILTDLEGGNDQYYKSFTGDGGVNQFYFGGSYKVTKNLVLGVNAVCLFGTLTNKEEVSYYYSLEDITYLSNFNLNYGLNYQIEKNSWKYNIGIVYNNGKSLNTDHKKTIAAYNGTTDVIETRTNDLKIPRSLGLGLALERNHFRAGIDFETKKWSGLDLNNSLLATRNSNRYSAGIEIPSAGAGRGYNNIFLFRIGAEYNKSYLIINGTPINYKAVTFGTGIPLGRALSVINLSMEIGQNGTTRNNLIKENSYVLHIDLSLKDQWFVKRRYQ